VEPFEDPLAFDRVHARPTIEHGQGPPTDDHVDGATRRIELARVVDEVGDRAVERRAGCVDGGLVGGGLVVINPPYTMPDGLDAIGGALLDAFGARGSGAYARDWIAPPR